MKTIRLIPEGGLANRMRAMDSASQLAKQVGLPLVIHWITREDFQCPLEQLFIFRKEVNIENAKGLKRKYQEKTEENYEEISALLNDNNELYLNYSEINNTTLKDRIQNHTGETTLRAYFRFWGTPSYHNSFQPIPELKARINEKVKGFTSNTIGIHIRRGDHIKSKEMSPTSLFTQKIENHLKQNSNDKFYIASDDKNVKEFLLAEFGKESIITEIYEHERATVEGIKIALVELYTLAATQEIWGSYYSSYSEAASHIGQIPLERLVK